VSRIFGPIAVGSIYTRYGTTWTFAITTIMMVFPMIWLYFLRHRLHIEPAETTKSVEMKELNGKASNGGLINGKSVIIVDNGTGDEQEHFLSNGR